MATEQADNNDVLERIMGSKKKLEEFHSDWNKLLESDSEDDEMESSLADDFSSTLRCSDYSDDLMDSIVTGNLDESNSQPQKLAVVSEEPEEVSSTEELTLAQDDDCEEAQSDSGLDVLSSSSSQLDDETINASTSAAIESSIPPALQVQPDITSQQAPPATHYYPVNNVLYYYSNLEQSAAYQGTYVAPVQAMHYINNKRNYDDFKAPTPKKASSKARQNDDALFRRPTSSPRLSRSSSQSSIRSTSTSAEPPFKRRGPDAPIHPLDFERDVDVIQRRQKQIDYGKNTLGYQNYVREIPKQYRSGDNPVTPNKFFKYSRRSWDQQVKIWRRKIHVFDPPEVIHYQTTNGVKVENPIRVVKKHLNFDQVDDSSSKENSSQHKRESVPQDEVPFDEIDVSDILDVDDFAL